MATAVIGTGFIGPVHVEALRRSGRPVVGIVGSSPEKSERAARELGLEVGYPDLDAVLNDDRVRVVHVASPNDTHADYAGRALRSGRHVVCEKPLATTSRQTSELLRVARANPELVAAVNYNLRFYPMAMYASELVRQGALGEIRHVNGSYVQDWLMYESDWNWRVSAAEGGALRAIGDIGTHWLDLAQHVSGHRIEGLVADLATFLPTRRRPLGSATTFGGAKEGGTEPVDVDTEDYGAVMLRFEGGARGTMHVSQVAAGRKNRLTLQVVGSEASLFWDGERPNELWIGHRDRPNELVPKDPALLPESVRRFVSYPGGHAEGFPDTFKQLYAAIYDYIDAGDMDAPRPFPTFADGHDEVLLCEAVLDSHRTERWVAVRGEDT